MAPPSAERMGAVITAAYKRAGLTQKQLAEATGVDQSTISAWASGKSWPSVWALPIIERLCEQRLGYFLKSLDGFIDERIDVEAAINRDPDLDDASSGALVMSYRAFAKFSTPSNTA